MGRLVFVKVLLPSPAPTGLPAPKPHVHTSQWVQLNARPLLTSFSG